MVASGKELVMPVAKSPEFRRRALELADHREPVRRTWPDRVL